LKNIDRRKVLRTIVCLGLLAGLVFSRELWFPLARAFPRAPLAIESPVMLDRLLAILLAVSLVSTIFFQRTKIFPVTALAASSLLVFFDQTRLQPWVYQYFLLLVVGTLTASETDSEPFQGLVQLVIAGLYFWSGLQKLNFSFAHETLPLLLAPLQDLFPSIALPYVWLGVGAALAETLIGGGLLFRKTRNPAVFSAVAMHLVILGLLIAKNHNSIVWIWNAALILMVVTAFWKSETTVSTVFRKAAGWKIKTAAGLVAASVLLPALSFFGLSDMYLAGALYSGNVEVAVIRVNDELFQKLPPKARESVFQTKTGSEKMLPLFEWSLAELNVPVYPEQRVFREVFRGVCKLTEDKGPVELIIKGRPAIFDGRYELTRTTCAALKK
jgi:hypothetical protein